MRTTLALAILLTTLPAADPPVRHVPRIVDREFAARTTLCRDAAAASQGSVRTNEAKLSLAEWLGPDLVELQVHQTGAELVDFGAAASHIRRLLARRPRFLSPFPPWAEATPLAAQGILGTLRYTGGRTGRFEIAGHHVCLQDSGGAFWWVRLAEVDIHR